MTKDLKDKAIDFKGKKYVLVADRVVYFNEIYAKGCIITELISPLEAETVVFKATVYPDGIGDNMRHFTGFSQATWGEGYINQSSALENAETSAVGRALALMGIGVIDSIASIDEINKTTVTKTWAKKEPKNVDKFLETMQPTDEEVITWQEKLESAKDIKELKDFWAITPPMVQDKLAKLKDDLKFKLA